MAGSGSYVTVGENKVDPAPGWVAGRNLLIEQSDRVVGIVNDNLDKMEEYLESFQNDIVNELGMPNGWEDLLTNIVLEDIQTVDAPARESLQTLNLNTNWPTDFPIQPVFADPPAVDLSFNEPAEPTDNLQASINFVEQPFSTTLHTLLQDRIIANIQAGGWEYDPAAEQGRYDRAKDRNRLANEVEYNKGLNFIGELGAALPSGAAASLQYRMQQTVIRQENDINEKVMIKMADMAWDSYNKSMDRGVGLDQIMISFHDNKQNRSLEAEKAIADLALRIFAERVTIYVKKLEGQKIGLEAQMLQVQAVLERNEAVIEEYKAKWDGFKAQVEAISSENESKTRAIEADARAYEAETNAYKAWLETLTENQRTKIEKAKLELEKAATHIKALLDSTVAVGELKKEAIESMTALVVQAVASSINAMGANVSHSTSSSESLQESHRHGANISETHYFDETE